MARKLSTSFVDWFMLNNPETDFCMPHSAIYFSQNNHFIIGPEERMKNNETKYFLRSYIFLICDLARTLLTRWIFFHNIIQLQLSYKEKSFPSDSVPFNLLKPFNWGTLFLCQKQQKKQVSTPYYTGDIFLRVMMCLKLKSDFGKFPKKGPPID